MISIQQPLIAAREAARVLRAVPSAKKDAVLNTAAELLSERRLAVLKANQQDLKALGRKATGAFRDRLLLDDSRIERMGETLRQVAALPDPVGEEMESRVLPNGLKLRKIRAPLGVIYMIFESRPNVAVEAFSLGFKAGNIMILRGGKESMRTVHALYGILTDALATHGVPPACLWGITNPDRKLTLELLKQRSFIDVVVPRGGDALIEFVVRNSDIPIIKNDRGLCHVYVHEDAPREMALKIVQNAKTQRPGVCNAMETLLVHASRAGEFIPRLYERISAEDSTHPVEWHACPATRRLLRGRPGVRRATAKSWDTEYLDFKMNCRVVDSLAQAIGHIDRHGSRHSEAIVTQNEQAARLFQSEIDAAAVYWNSSTRFTDGFEFGLGGELGISTQKLHARGPVGLRELTSGRWWIDGQGQVRP